MISNLPIVSISDLRRDTARIIERVVTLSEPIVITRRGRACAVLVSVAAYERMQREIQMLRVLVQGDADIAAGVGHDAEDVMAEADALLTGE